MDNAHFSEFAVRIGRRTPWLGPVVVSCCFMSISPVQAQRATATIVGLGATTCSQFSREVNANPAVQRDYLAWAQGFMSGILLGRPPGVDEGLDLSPSTFGLLKQLEFLRGYCAQHPMEDFSDAGTALYKRLRSEGGT